jgi:outer membrane protein OmpA-like peptidoglycan-associated protein
VANKGDFSHSFTDLMTSLAVIFILLLVASLNNAFSESDEAIKDLRKEVAEQLRELNLTLTQDPDDPYTQIINLDEEKVKFALNRDALRPEGKELIGNLFSILTPKLCHESLYSKIESIIIEGHTDSTGNLTTEGKLKNVKLSQDRAYAVMDEAFSSIDRNAPNDVDCLRRLASATGRGSNRPLSDRPDSASRRVEVKIRVKAGYGLSKNFPKEER